MVVPSHPLGHDHCCSSLSLSLSPSLSLSLVLTCAPHRFGMGTANSRWLHTIQLQYFQSICSNSQLYPNLKAIKWPVAPAHDPLNRHSTGVRLFAYCNVDFCFHTTIAECCSRWQYWRCHCCATRRTLLPLRSDIIALYISMSAFLFQIQRFVRGQNNCDRRKHL